MGFIRVREFPAGTGPRGRFLKWWQWLWVIASSLASGFFWAYLLRLPIAPIMAVTVVVQLVQASLVRAESEHPVRRLVFAWVAGGIVGLAGLVAFKLHH